MPISVQINLRVPDLSVRDVSGRRRISNGDVRFWKVIDVETLPKVGDAIELSARTIIFQATVKRVNWEDDKNCFVVACHYAKRSIALEEFESLKTDLDWTMKPLLPLA